MKHAILTLAIATMITAAAAFAPASASVQQLSCEPTSAPLLETIEFVPARLTEVPFANLGEMRLARLLCKDGRVLVLEMVGEPAALAPTAGPPPPFPFTAFLSAGTVPAASFTSLQKAMGDAQIGFRGDCRITLDPLFGLPHLKITWFGRAGRRNTFRVESVSSSPPCPDVVVPLVLAILDLGPAPGGSQVVIE
jgi:hypothetical protein